MRALLGIAPAVATSEVRYGDLLAFNSATLPANGWYLPSANTLGVATNSASRGTISATGNWTMAAPTASGITLTVMGRAQTAYGPAMQILGPNTTSQSNGLYIAAGTNANDMALEVSGATGGPSGFVLFAVNGDSSWQFQRAAGTSTLSGSPSGAITIGSPTSGTNALAVNGNTAISGIYYANQGTALQVTSGLSASQVGGDINVSRAGSTANAFGKGPSLGFDDTAANSNALFQLSGGQVELWLSAAGGGLFKQIFYVPTTGGLVINPPTSGGIALTVLGLSGSPSAYVKGASTSGSSYGLQVLSGTTSGDQCAAFYNQAGSSLFLNVRGDGAVVFPLLGSGSASFGSGGVLASASDGRYKTKTRAVTDAIPTILKLAPTYYRWKEGAPFASDYEELGFVAQEVASVIPEASPEPEGAQFKNYHDRALLAFVVKAIQEQQAQLTALAAAVAALTH